METSDTLFFEAGQEVGAKFEKQRSRVSHSDANPRQVDENPYAGFALDFDEPALTENDVAPSGLRGIGDQKPEGRKNSIYANF